MKDPVSELAELLVGARMKQDLSRPQLAKRFRSKRITAALLCRWESYDATVIPPAEILERIAKVYKLDLEQVRGAHARSLDALTEARRIRKESLATPRRKATDPEGVYKRFRLTNTSIPEWARSS